MDAPKTLQEAIVYFSDPDRCFQYALKLRWQDGAVACPRCGSEKHAFIKTRRIWYCNPCKKQFTLKVGTIFEDSPIPLSKWLPAIWLYSAGKKGRCKKCGTKLTPSNFKVDVMKLEGRFA